MQTRFSAQRVAWSPDGLEIAVSDPRCEGVRIFTASGAYLRKIGDTAPWFARLEGAAGVAYSPDGRQIVVTDTLKNFGAIFKVTGEFVTLLGMKGNGGDPKIQNPWDVAYSPDGEIIALSSGRLYDKAGKFLRALPLTGASLSFFPDGKTLAFVQSNGKPRIKIVDLQGAQVAAFGTPMGPGQEKVPGLTWLPMGISCSPDGKMVAVVDERQNRLLFYDRQGTHIDSWDGKDGTGATEFGFPRGVAFSPDGSKLALTDSRNERVMVFATARPLVTLKPVSPPAGK